MKFADIFVWNDRRPDEKLMGASPQRPTGATSNPSTRIICEYFDEYRQYHHHCYEYCCCARTPKVAVSRKQRSTARAAARFWSSSSMKRQRCPSPPTMPAVAFSSLRVAPSRRTDSSSRDPSRPAPLVTRRREKEHNSGSSSSSSIDIRGSSVTGTPTTNTVEGAPSSMDSLFYLEPVLPKRGRRQRRRWLSAVGGVSALAAALAAAVLGGVPVADAAMTEAQCVDATLLGTEEELAATPRADTATEAVAAGIDRKVVASQETYDRLILDQIVMKVKEGPDLPPLRNLWSDRTWLGTTDVTFDGAESLADFEEGNPPEFICMNEHYGMSFVKEDAGETVAHGKLTSEKVVNWSVLEPYYTGLDGIDAFEPTPESVVGLTTVFVAAKYEEADSFHYFLSKPAAEVDQSTCPEPCTGDIVTYYWSINPGTVYVLDRASTDADPTPCWLPVYDEIKHGPPSKEISMWSTSCIIGLVEALEEAKNNGSYSSSSNNGGGGGVVATDAEGADAAAVADSGGSAAVIAAVIIAVALVCFIGAAFLLMRHQRARRVEKMRTTDEAWGQGLDGSGMPKKQAVSAGGTAVVVGEEGQRGGGGGEEEELVGPIKKRKSFPPPKRAFTDISMEDNEDDVEAAERAAGGESEEEVDAHAEDDAVYPLDV